MAGRVAGRAHQRNARRHLLLALDQREVLPCGKDRMDALAQRLAGFRQFVDAAGLGLFSVSGTQKALAFGIDPVIAALLGMLTGIGGGMVRDVLVREIPTVLRKDLYALAALAGAAVVVVAPHVYLTPTAATIGGATLCFGLRLLAIWRRWALPTPDRAG